MPTCKVSAKIKAIFRGTYWFLVKTKEGMEKWDFWGYLACIFMSLMSAKLSCWKNLKDFQGSGFIQRIFTYNAISSYITWLLIAVSLMTWNYSHYIPIKSVQSYLLTFSRAIFFNYRQYLSVLRCCQRYSMNQIAWLSVLTELVP